MVGLDAAAAKYMQKQGLIRIYPSKHDWSGKPLEVTELTDKGKKYLFSIDQRPSGEFIYTVKMCEAKFLRVTGIAKNQPSLARVEYEWTYDNPTPFATAYVSTGAQLRSWDISNFCVKELQVPLSDALYFQLYDDGWRLSEPARRLNLIAVRAPLFRPPLQALPQRPHLLGLAGFTKIVSAACHRKVRDHDV